MGGRMALGSTGLESSTFRDLNQNIPGPELTICR